MVLSIAETKIQGEKNPEAYPLGYVEDFFEPRTKPGKRHVSACLRWAGENVAFFSMLLPEF
jgi:hypothetical protein